MTYEVFYKTDNVIDSIVIEGDTIEEIQESINIELKRKNATYKYSNWLNN